MYLYFNKEGVLKEIINDLPLRQGSYNVNKIYVFVEEYETREPEEMEILYSKPSSGTVFPMISSYTRENIEVPYSPKRDLKFFKYYTKYNFFVIPTAFEAGGTQYNVLNEVVTTSLQVIIDNLSLGLIVFNIEEGAVNQIKPEEYISLAQFQYLLANTLPRAVIERDYVLKSDLDNYYTKTEIEALLGINQE